MSYKIKYIDYGTGNRVGNTIYLNRNLKKYPKLHKAILKHEKNHTSGWGLKDFWFDIRNKEIIGLKKEFYKFVLTHPRSWINYSPVMKLNGIIAFDVSLFLFWFTILLIIMASVLYCIL